MPEQPNNDRPIKPPSEPLTPAEAEELSGAIRETDELFQKLIEQNRQPKADSPTPTPPSNALKNRGTNFPAR
jgi:hypothetical protein